MKKIGYWLATVSLAVICVCALVACGGVAGTYKFYSMTVEGFEIKAGEEMGGIEIPKDMYVLKLKSDGTAVMTVKSGNAEVTGEGSWKLNEEDETKVEITIDGETQTATLDGNKIVLGMDGASITLKK